MNALEKYFFTPIYYPRSMWSVLGWWESRRPLYNVAVGAAGVATILAATAIELLPPDGSPVLIPWAVLARGVLAYGVLANVCYSLGAPADVLLRRVLGDRAAAVGPVLFRYGFAFSLGLTLLPIPFFLLGRLIRFFL
jgi:hypothetical protein